MSGEQMLQKSPPRPFLSLPTEIRFKIYSYLFYEPKVFLRDVRPFPSPPAEERFKQYSSLLCGPQIFVRTKSSGGGVEISAGVAMLWTCKQICSEVLKALGQNLTLHMVFKTRLGQPRIPLPRHVLHRVRTLIYHELRTLPFSLPEEPPRFEELRGLEMLIFRQPAALCDRQNELLIRLEEPNRTFFRMVHHPAEAEIKPQVFIDWFERPGWRRKLHHDQQRGFDIVSEYEIRYIDEKAPLSRRPSYPEDTDRATYVLGIHVQDSSILFEKAAISGEEAHRRDRESAPAS